MSDLQRSFARSKLVGLPTMAPEAFREEDEDEEIEEDEEEKEKDVSTELPIDHLDDDSSSASSASSTGTIRPTIQKKLFARPARPSNKGSSLEPLPWTSFFERELYLPVTHDSITITHHAYFTSSISPMGPLFVTHHGAGSTGLSFAALALSLRTHLPTAGILSLDARGHGLTKVTDATGSDTATSQRAAFDLSLSTLSADLIAVLSATASTLHWPTLPPLILVGHSLGGAVITDVAQSGLLGDNVLGYAVLDVVEGSAMDALASMQTYLATRPSGFASVTAGIEWHLRTRTIRNRGSAKVSVPGLLCLAEEKDIVGGGKGNGEWWVWKTDLAATQPFWEGWFVGLSAKFLEARGGKLLLLAGTDRLDRELMIGHMQGKFALQVLPEAGHFIHEDQPEKTAVFLANFYKRNDRSALVLPPKVGDILKVGRKM